MFMRGRPRTGVMSRRSSGILIPNITICLFLYSDSSDLLPMDFPAGVDPSTYALPVFLIEPTDAFAAKGRPAVLKCRAAHAISVRFECNDEVLDSASSAEGAMSANEDLKFLEATVEIKRGQVFDILGHFSCKCVATSERGEVESEEAIIQTACESTNQLHLSSALGKKEESDSMIFGASNVMATTRQRIHRRSAVEYLPFPKH